MTNTTMDSKFYASPSVRKLARELGVDLSLVKASGAKNRITIVDVKYYVKNNLTNINTRSIEVEKIAITKTKTLAIENIINAWQDKPHLYQFDEVNVDQMQEFLLNQDAQQVKISVLAFVMKVLVRVLKNNPLFNSQIDKDIKNILVKKYYNFGFTVNVENSQSMAVIKNVEQKSLVEINKEIDDLIKGAKFTEPQDNIEEITFMLFDFTDLSTANFTSMLSYLNVANLGISKIQKKSYWDGKNFIPINSMPVSLSCDGRIIDNFQAAKFLQEFNYILENIMEILL